MKNTTLLARAVLLFVLSGFISSAYAEPQMLYTHNRIRFLSGGIGHDEVLEMRKTAKHYSLNLLFSEGKVGRAVTGHTVDIYNAQNEQVFKLKNAKPLLYVELPAGNYTLVANNNGVKLRHQFTLSEHATQKIILNWKDEVEEDALTEDAQ